MKKEVVAKKGPLDRYLVQNPELAWREIDGQAAIVEPAGGTLYVLNEVGSFVWKNIEKPAKISAVAKKITTAFEVGKEQAQEDLLAFVDELASIGVLTISDSKPAAGE